MGTYLELSNISKNFAEFKALQDINLNVEQGSFVCLLGPSGCGKTTLLRIIAGFETASSGDLFLNGENISNVPAHKRDFGMVFQSLALFPHMNVAENIAYGLKLRGIKGTKSRDRVDELLNIIDLPSIAGRGVAELSGGQKQRVAIARALAVQPRLFLLDEPLSALDAQLRDNMQIELRQLQQKFGVTTILVTHDQTEAMMLADSLVVLKDGVIRQVAAPAEVYREPIDPFVAEFLGASNIIHGVTSARGFIELFGFETQMPSKAATGARLDVSVRSTGISLRQYSDSDKLPIGTVEFVRDLGSVIELIIIINETRLRVRSVDHSLQHVSVGEKLGVEFDVKQCSGFDRG